MRRLILPIILGGIFFSGLFFLANKENNFEFGYSGNAAVEAPIPPATPELKKEEEKKAIISKIFDIENQKPLQNPPQVIKALYATSWSAGSTQKLNHLVDLARKTEVNAFVVDIKDYSGVIAYDIKVPDVLKYGAREVRIPKINSFIKRMHDENIYLIARVTVFQDPMLAKARPELAIRDATNGKQWKDRLGLSWIDPGSKEAWDYIISIAKDAAERGFDEINFDYIRFPSDGDLSIAEYPFSDLKTQPRREVLKKFFVYLRENTKGIKISADLFGLTSNSYDDLGIGQIIEYAYESFDYVAPMIYPSHYAPGFLGYKNPAQQPYEVVFNSVEAALKRLVALNKINGGGSSKLRPWLQDFDLGALYDAEKVRSQMTATTDALCKVKLPDYNKAEGDSCDTSIGEDIYGGWMLWDPTNNYTRGALLAADN